MVKKARTTDRPANPVERYYHVSQTQLSIARYYGRAMVQGVLYHYNPIEDELIRDDVLKRECQWCVIRAGEDDSKDEYALRTTDGKTAKQFINKDRSGRLLGLFGPDGWVGFFKDGGLA